MRCPQTNEKLSVSGDMFIRCFFVAVRIIVYPAEYELIIPSHVMKVDVDWCTERMDDDQRRSHGIIYWVRSQVTLLCINVIFPTLSDSG